MSPLEWGSSACVVAGIGSGVLVLGMQAMEGGRGGGWSSLQWYWGCSTFYLWKLDGEYLGHQTEDIWWALFTDIEIWW